MRFNYKQTILVGLAFFSICAFWQLYDNIVPLILRDSFALGDTASGIVMSLDNVLALVLLPLFGAWSDRKGLRMPFILAGTLLAAAFAIALPFAARSGSLTIFFAVLGLLLLAMSSYRSPAVAYMPDLTPKPLRSKGNAVINLMGALGGVYTLAMIQLLVRTPQNGQPDYLPVFLSVALLMIGAVATLALTVKEKAARLQARQEENEQFQPAGSRGTLTRDMKKSLILILCSVALWYMGYNAVTTAFTKYATAVWGQNVGQASACLMVATIGAVASYIPIGMLSSRIGRKKTVLIGVGVLCGCFVLGAVAAGVFSSFLYIMFLLVGFAWAAINVNSYPMVVEISQSGDVGKYTGYYYAFSMAAQVATPIISGALLEHVGYHTLFPYAAGMVGLAFFTMLFTRLGDNKPPRKGSHLEHFDAGD